MSFKKNFMRQDSLSPRNSLDSECSSHISPRQIASQGAGLTRVESISNAWPFIHMDSSDHLKDGKDHVDRESDHDSSDKFSIFDAVLRPLDFNLRVIARVFDMFFIRIPDFLCNLLPHSSSVTAIATLYLFAQAMALVWGFIVVSSSVMVTTATQWMEDCHVQGPKLWDHCIDSPFDLVRILVRLYMNYTVVRVSYFLAKGLFELGFEAYGDFAHVRCLLNPQIYYSSVTSLTQLNEQSSQADHARKSRVMKAIQRIVLITPLLTLLVLSVALLFVPNLKLLLNKQFDNDLAPLLQNILDNLEDKRSRLNRTLRFTFFIAILQWAQQFHCQFPLWYKGLRDAPRSLACRVLFYCVGPLSSFRLCEWFLCPSQPSKLTPYLGGLAYSSIDNLLVLSWILLLFWTAVLILNLPDSRLRSAGWRKVPRHLSKRFASDCLHCRALFSSQLSLPRMSCIQSFQTPPDLLGTKTHYFLALQELFSNSHMWCKLTQRFNFMFLFCSFLHFLRGFASKKMGFTFAQNDFIVISIAYPCLLVFVWTVAFLAVMLRFRHVVFIPLLTCGSWIVCRFLGGVAGVGVVSAVWVHLGRQLVKVFGTRSSLIKNVLSGDENGRTRVGPRRARGYGRRMASGIAKVFGAAGIGLFFVIIGMSIASILEKGDDWFPNGQAFIPLKTPDGNLTRVTHGFVDLNLYTNESVGHRTGLPEYMICDSKFYGLTPLDYSLLAMASYFPSATLDDALQSLFPPSSSSGAERGEPPRTPYHVPFDGPAEDEPYVFWSEIVMPQENVTVISIRGTEFWKVGDWLEDIRLWTEPCVFSLLRIVFPTIGAWSPHTSAMVFDNLHSLLDAVGLPDPEYKYSRLVRYLATIKKRLPPGHNIVLTGHSLGGGVAHIIAGLENLPAVSFSPPGAYQSLSKHLYWNAKEKRQMHESAHNRTLTFLVENDMIGRMFDTHGGLVQTLTCNTDHLGPLGCHMVENTVCNLIRHCNNDQRWQGCDFAYTEQPIMQGFTKAVTESWAHGRVAAAMGMLGATILSMSAAGVSMKYVIEKL